MKTRILLIILICFCLKAEAQIQILFQSDQTKSYLLSYINSYEESQQVINEMIDAIAKFVPKPVYQTKITFTIDESIKITREKNVVSIYVNHQNIIINGDIYYKGFNMTDVLIPSKYEFTATLSRKNGSSVADFTQQKINFNPLFNEVLLVCNDSLPAVGYNFMITSNKFYYDISARNRFRDKASLIDQYYMAETDLSGISKQLSAVNPNAFEDIEKTQTYLNKLKATTDNISGAAFWQALHVEAFDPLKLYIKLSDVRRSQTEVQNQLNYTKSVIHQLYYNKGVEAYNKKKTQEAKSAFEKSLTYNTTFAPSQFYLAQIAFDAGKTEEARQQIKKLFTFSNIDDDTKKAAYSLAGAIEWTDMNIAAGLLTGGKYTEALAAIDKAEKFCQSIPSYTCNDTINLIRRDCHLAIYSGYMKSANNLFIQKKYKDAGNEVQKAIFYQEKYQNYIPGNLDALDLKQKIKIEEYSYVMTKGKEKMVAKEYRGAFEEFFYAQSIENDYPVRKDKLLPELLKKSKLEVLLLDIDDAEMAVKNNKLESARTILRRVIDEQRTYELTNNPALSARIESLRKSIFSQECMNAQKEYDTKIETAIKAENEKNFIVAENTYKEALKTVENNSDCGISDELAKKGLAKVEKPAQYQRSLNECDKLAKDFSYLKAIETYNNLTAFYNINSISDYGISHQPLQLYIASFPSGFAYYGLSWFINAGELDNAMFLLKQLKQRNTIKSTTKAQQIALARAYAISDYKKDNTLNPKLKVIEYTLGDKWFSYFSKEYLKQMKKFK